MQMLAMRRSGHAVRAIALYFRVTERHVRREIASTPAWVKERVDAVLV
jgi:transcriptional antiterminator